MDPTSGNNSAALAQLAQADITFDDENVDGFVTRGIMYPENFFVCASLPFTFNECLATDRENRKRKDFQNKCRCQWRYSTFTLKGVYAESCRQILTDRVLI